MAISSVVLLAHSDPPIHGQAVAASALIEESRDWTSIALHPINAVYARDRGSLTGFSFGKVCLLAKYLFQTVRVARSQNASAIIVTPAFFRGPFLKDALVLLTLRFLTKARLIGWVHMDPNRIDLENAPKWFQWIARKSLDTVSLWVACAPSLVNHWPDFLPKSRCTGLANGISAPSLPEKKSTNQRLRVIYLSAMDREKGWREALQAARSLCEKGLDLEFHFYGNALSEEDREVLQAEFSKGPHADRIQWLGPAWGEEKWQALQQADLFCFPSYTEQFPIAVLDAMAASLPVVASKVGAVADAIVPDVGGWLVPPRDAAALECAIESALSDPIRLKAFGRQNQEIFRARFSRQAFGKSWETLLTSHPLLS